MKKRKGIKSGFKSDYYYFFKKIGFIYVCLFAGKKQQFNIRHMKTN